MKVGIALSGGGIRGIAHAGVLKALEDNKINIDVIGGTSAGGMVASLYAIGYTPDEIYEIFKKNAKKIIGANSIPFITGIRNFMNKKGGELNGFRNGKNIEEVYEIMAEEKGIKEMNQIKMPIVIPTVDIIDSKEYIFTNFIPEGTKNTKQYITDISVGKAVRASSSFPAVFNTCSVNMHAFIDGGALNNVPVNEVKKQGADKVIAVKFDADKVDETSNIMDIAMKTIDIMGSKIAEENLSKSDYVLNVNTDKVGLLDFEKLEGCFNYGYDAVIKNIEEIRNALKN